MRVTLENVVSGAEDVWTSHIEPQRLLRLGKPIHQWGRLSIVMVSKPFFDGQNQLLQFDLDSAILLNVGNTTEAILIDSRESKSHHIEINSDHIESTITTKVRVYSSGDSLFHEKLLVLPGSVKNIGEQLLDEIRKQFPGELVFHRTTGKFVETPDNFWVVKIQPRAKSLRIIVYGSTLKHGTYSSIRLTDDRPGYSTFVINNQDQLREAVDVILEAKRLKDNK